ncbi:MAG: NAD(+)/NADH kinase [Bacteroidales bacterium]|nr:NAD(+)/NADH kinase [Bacteroidales bacterium]
MNIAIVIKNSATRLQPDYQRLLESLSRSGVSTTVIDSPIARGEYDFVLAVGGDGTMLAAVGLVRDSGVPLVGVNFGHLGFLTTLAAADTDSLVANLSQGRYTIESHTLLHATIGGADDLFVLNELALHRQLDAPLMQTRVSVDSSYVATYTGDGLIVATPTGSTAYSLSCGGPILTPNAACNVITPIGVHTLTLRPIIVPASAHIELSTNPGDHPYCLSADSDHRLLTPGATIDIEPANFAVGIVRMGKQDFFSAIHEKLSWDA